MFSTEQPLQTLNVLSTVQGTGHATGHREQPLLNNTEDRTNAHTLEACERSPNLCKPEVLHRERRTRYSWTQKHPLNLLFVFSAPAYLEHSEYS